MTDETLPDETTTEAGAATAEQTAGGETEDKKPAKLQQEVEFKDIGPCKKHIKVSVDRSAIDTRMEEQFKKLMKDQEVAVPGFRPGKAPRKIIEKRYHKEVSDQVKAEVLLQSLEQLADDHDVAPLSAPDLDPNKVPIPETGPFIYEFDVEVRPQFDLPDYKGLKLKRPVQTFTDADIRREQVRLLEPYGQLVPKPAAEGKKEPELEDGDYLFADLTTRDGDKVMSTAKEIKIRVEPRLAFKDGVADKFGEQVKGAKPGDSRVVDIKLSDSVAVEALRNKSVKATVEVKDIKIVKLPELTHELCHQFGVHSEDQLGELVKVLLDRRLQYQQRQAARRQVLAQIASASSWELPQDLLMRQARGSLNRRVMEMRSSGISEDEIRARLRLLQQDTLQSTALGLKEHFVMQKIAEVEKIEVNDDDISDEIERMAAQYDEPPRRVRARLEKEDMMDALAAEIVERKALDLVLNSAEYEDVPLGQTEEAAVSTVEEQAIPGEMTDPTAAPPPETSEEAPKS
jgi:trigger factor